MSEQIRWHSVEEIFLALNKANCNYIVLRNFECFQSGQVFMNGHDDIDLLCDNIKQVRQVLDVRRRFYYPAVNSYYIQYNDQKVSVDIRFVGDGYYETAWQLDMLKNKVPYNQYIYVMDSENYFYSLIYHAIFHKHFLSLEYLKKLSDMGLELERYCDSEALLLLELNQYMKIKGYKMTLPKDPGINLNFKNLKDVDLEIQYFWLIRRRILDTLKKVKYIGDKYV